MKNLKQEKSESLEKREKIALLIPSLTKGGAERVSSIILNSLCDRYEFHLVLFDYEIDFTLDNRIKVYNLKTSKWGKFKIGKFIELYNLAYKYWKYCQSQSIDISFSMMYRPCFVAGISRTLFGNKSRLIFNERSFPSRIFLSENILSGLIKKFIKKYYNKADLVITNSIESGFDLKNTFDIKSTIKTIYNPIDLSLFKERKPKQNRTFTFICVANFHTHKRQELLIEAMTSFKDMPVNLVFVGAGVTLRMLKRKALERNLSHQIIFLGKQDNVAKHLQEADCFVLTSKFEGFPNAILEAMACGLPIISSDCSSGPREILSPKSIIVEKVTDHVEYGEYGILYPMNNSILLAEAMLKLYENSALREKYRKLSLERSQDFSKDNILTHYCRVFDSK